MMIRKELLNNLKDFGLNSYEIKLWVALLSRGISSASELSEISGVPRSRTYDVLESLERKGFIVQRLGRPVKYIAVSPNEVIERVKKNIQEEAKENIGIIDKFKDTELFEELNLLHSQGVDVVDPDDLSGLLKERKNLYNHLEYLINQATNSVVILTNEDGLLRKITYLYNPLKAAHDRKVKVRIASKLSKKFAPKIKEKLNFAEIRHTDKLNGRLFIIDNKHVVLPLLDGVNIHPSFDSGVWVSTEHLGNTLSTMFEHMWKDMVPIDKFLKK